MCSREETKMSKVLFAWVFLSLAPLLPSKINHIDGDLPDYYNKAYTCGTDEQKVVITQYGAVPYSPIWHQPVPFGQEKAVICKKIPAASAKDQSTEAAVNAGSTNCRFKRAKDSCFCPGRMRGVIHHRQSAVCDLPGLAWRL